MKLSKGQINFMVNRDGTTIEIIDGEASTTFVVVKLTPEQLSAALARFGNTPCEIEIRSLDRVGKKHENAYHEFELPEKLSRWEKKDLEKIERLSQETAPEGWISDKSFNSQNSFFTKDGKQFARTIIRRWVEIGELIPANNG